MELPQDFSEFFALLDANRAEYLVVGAYALAVHGAPRFTGEIDILIRPTRENAERVLEAIRACGFATDAISADRRHLPGVGAATRSGPGHQLAGSATHSSQNVDLAPL